MKKKPSLPRGGHHEFRIIAGQWRGRKFSFPDAEGLRPSHDRIRETLFNWLVYEVEGSRCLDLFAGSGALGLEALSRGAVQVDFVELNPAACRSLQQHLKVLKCSNAQVTVTTADALGVISQLPDAVYDLVFLDPPFRKGWLDKILEHPGFKASLTADAHVYIERESGVSLPGQWRMVKEKSTATLTYGLYQLGGD